MLLLMSHPVFCSLGEPCIPDLICWNLTSRARSSQTGYWEGAAWQALKDSKFHLRTNSYGRDFRLNPDKWIPGTVLPQLGPVTYDVKVEKGKVLKRHIDHMRERMVINDDCPSVHPDENTIQDNFHYPAVFPVPLPDAIEESKNDVPARRYPVRERRPPDRFMSGFVWELVLAGRKCGEWTRTKVILEN